MSVPLGRVDTMNRRRHELLDGTLVVSPRPAIGHQRVGFRLAYALEAPARTG
jgi:hypothetical protein